jgi:ethanolamine kinase
MVTVTHLDVRVEHDSLQEDALKVVRIIRPEWKNKDISVIVFTDGITNRLMGCFLSSNPDDKVLIRVYGEKTELFIDREVEKRNIRLMNEAGLAPPLFASFTNGLAYEFTPGKPIDYEMVRHPIISKLIADKMAKMHSLVKCKQAKQCVSQSNPHEPGLFKMLNRYLSLINNALTSPDNSSGIPDVDQLRREVSFLESILLPLESPIVFCHNDLLLKNIIYHQKPKEGVTFIDFEFADFNFQAFDIANHFCEFAGIEVYEPSLYPDIKFQRKWLESYVSSWRDFNPPSPVHVKLGWTRSQQEADEVDKLLSHVQKFTLAAHLLWGVWALIQAQHSSLHFDFKGYAKSRLTQYLKDKSNLHLKENGSPMVEQNANHITPHHILE